MEKMFAYHGDTVLKEKFVALLESHQRTDRFLQGSYWDSGHNTGFVGKAEKSGKGCAVGCSINSIAIINDIRLDRSAHELYEEFLGVPEVLAHLEDTIFEHLVGDDALNWPVAFAKAIPVGADLSKVWHRLQLWLLTDSTYGIVTHASAEEWKVALKIVNMLERSILGEEIPYEEIRLIQESTYVLQINHSDYISNYVNRTLYTVALGWSYVRGYCQSILFELSHLISVPSEFYKAISEKLLELLSSCVSVENVLPNMPERTLIIPELVEIGVR